MRADATSRNWKEPRRLDRQPYCLSAASPRWREPTRADPAPDLTRIARAAENPELVLLQCLVRQQITAPDFGERTYRRFDDQGDFVARVVPAQVDFPVFDHQPPFALTAPAVREAKLNDDPLSRREQFAMCKATDIPHEESGIELFALESTADPTCAPVPERHDEGPQFFSRGGHTVLGPGLGLHALDHTDFLELAESLRKQGRRHARYSASNVVEVRAAAQQLADDQRRPALAENFGTTSDGTELPITEHVRTLLRLRRSVR